MSAEGTDRRSVGASLIESAEQLHEIFSHAAVGIALMGLDGEWLRVNNRYCEMLGYPEAELRSKTLEDLTHPDDWDATLTVRRRLLAGEVSSHTIEKRYIRKDGTIFWGRLHRSLARDRDNRPKYVIAVVEDIIEKIQAERALRDKERQLVLAETAGRLGFWERDLRTGVTVTSSEFARLHGLTPNQLPEDHERYLQLVHSEDRQRVRMEYQESLERTHLWDTEFRVTWPDGSVHWLLAKGQVFLDDAGRPVRLAGINLDITERKRAAAALRESEERLRFAQQAARIGTFDWNIENGVNTWTPELEAMHGLPPGGFLGTQAAWEDLVHPDDRARAVQLVTKSFEAGTPTRGEWRVVWPDGSVHWLSGRWQVFKNSVGKPVRMTGVNIDVTDRQHVKQALLQSEERFRLAIKATNDAIWDLDLETGTVTWNETYSTLYGRPTETSDSWLWWIARIHAEDRERTVGGLHAAISNGATTWTSEYRFQRIDGAWVYIHDRAYIARDASGKAWRVIGAMQDLTERKEAEATLRESEQHLKNAERLAHIGHWQWDIRADRVSGSEEMFRIFGKPRNYIPSYEGFLQDLMPKDRERMERLIRDSLERKIGHSIEYQIAHTIGDLRTISCIWEVALDEEGLPVRVFGTCQDITDSRRAQEESFAKQKLESLGVLARGIAHDFNNLLGGVLAHSELALAELADNSKPEEELRRIRDAAIRGGEMVQQLMVYAGEETEALKLVDVSGIVKDMLELLKLSVSKHVSVETNLGKQLRAVRANPSQIRQVLMNLFYNASEAIGDRDGVIRVTTGQVTIDPDWSLATSERMAEGVYVQLEVADTGRGMTHEVQARIFEPFFTTKATGSHGLGLATVQEIAERLHGTIRLSSEPGKGSRFQIMLPCEEQMVEATHSGIARAVYDTLASRGATILVVEDEDLLRQGVSKMLRTEGLSVLEASDGSAALDVIRTRKGEIDVLLLDITLPGASSRKVYEEAKRLRPDLPVIVTSAKSEGMAAAFLATEIERFIRKPFRLGDLSDMIRQVLSSDFGTQTNGASM